MFFYSILNIYLNKFDYLYMFGYNKILTFIVAFIDDL